MRWGGGKLRHAHRRAEDDRRLLAGLLWFVLTILIVVVERPAGLA